MSISLIKPLLCISIFDHRCYQSNTIYKLETYTKERNFNFLRVRKWTTIVLNNNFFVLKILIRHLGFSLPNDYLKIQDLKDFSHVKGWCLLWLLKVVQFIILHKCMDCNKLSQMMLEKCFFISHFFKRGMLVS